MQFTACYTKTESGYMGQLIEWPNVITEGENLNDCREMLTDAALEMIKYYRDEAINIPAHKVIVETININEPEDNLKINVC